MQDRSLYLAQAEAWVGAKQGSKEYNDMLAWFNKNPKKIKADTENCYEFCVACALKAFGVNQTYIPVSNYSKGGAQLWPGGLKQTPARGCIAFFDYKDGNGISHSEVVTDVTDKEIKTINGNFNHSVVKATRNRTYKYFAGFGIPAWKEKEDELMTSWVKAAIQQIVLKEGSYGPLVLWMQDYLKSQGFYKAGLRDSKFQGYMKEEVIKWQKANGLYPDGEVAYYSFSFILKEALK